MPENQNINHFLNNKRKELKVNSKKWISGFIDIIVKLTINNYLIKLLLLPAFLGTICCQTNDNIKSTYKLNYEIDVENCLTTEKSLLLSELCSYVKYIILEDQRESMLSDIIDIRISKEYIFILATNGVFQFDNNGKFIRKVGRKGNGPGEYYEIKSFDINENQRKICMFDLLKGIFVYNFEGEYGHTIKRTYIPDYWTFRIINEKTYAFSYSTTKFHSYPYKLGILNFNGDILKVHDNYAIKEINSGGSERWSDLDNYFYKLRDTLYYKGKYNDTVFYINPVNFTLKPHIWLNLGKYKLPTEKTPEYTNFEPGFENIASKYIWPKVQETNRFVIITYKSYVFSDNYQGILYNKLTRSGYKVLQLENKDVMIKNDLDFWPVIIDNSVLISWKSGIKVLEELRSEKNLSRKRMLAERFKEITENSNPVIIIAY